MMNSNQVGLPIMANMQLLHQLVVASSVDLGEGIYF